MSIPEFTLHPPHKTGLLNVLRYLFGASLLFLASEKGPNGRYE